MRWPRIEPPEARYIVSPIANAAQALAAELQLAAQQKATVTQEQLDAIKKLIETSEAAVSEASLRVREQLQAQTDELKKLIRHLELTLETPSLSQPARIELKNLRRNRLSQLTRLQAREDLDFCGILSVPQLQEINATLKEARVAVVRKKKAASFLPNLLKIADLDLAYGIGKMAALPPESHRELSEADRRTQRVVNTWFTDGDRILSKMESLAAGSCYTLKLQIGPASVYSIVKDAQPLDEELLEHFYSAEGLELSVVLFSSAFEIEKSEKTLFLPRPPKETRELEFSLRTPAAPGLATLRLCIYFRRNLLQSLIIRAEIVESAPKGLCWPDVCLEAEVDFALTGSFVDLDELPEQTVCFAANQQGSTHIFYVYGDGLKQKIDLRNLSEGVEDARKEMQKVCAGSNPDKPRYQFDKQNQGTEAKFVKQVQGLAEMGCALYNNFVTGEDTAFEEKLRKALGESARIHVAATQRASYVFPWALVYDKRLVIGENTVCSQFLKDLRDNTRLDTQTCLVNGCGQTSASVICPSGFWGFRHLIEQPLSIHQADNDSPKDSLRNVVLTIDSPRPITCLVGLSEKLKYADDHEKELQGLNRLGSLSLDVKRTKADIGVALKRRDVALIYFYCHGGRRSSRPWLGIGKVKERLYPSDLKGWEIDWPTVHPLVFINGCGTAAITPEDLLTFNRMLTRTQAAGVIGTEISVPERLARTVGKDFITDFIGGAKVVEAIRALRLRLLQKYNPLGLVYTPYCSVGLGLN